LYFVGELLIFFVLGESDGDDKLLFFALDDDVEFFVDPLDTTIALIRGALRPASPQARFFRPVLRITIDLIICTVGFSSTIVFKKRFITFIYKNNNS